MHRAPTIIRSVLSDQVKEHLLSAILTGEYPPGARIVETRVARDLGVSQGPVREALRDLEALGVIESTRYQGARVRQPSKQELFDAYGVRAVLESYGARLAMARLSDSDLLALQTYHRRMIDAARLGDREEQVRMDVAFHAKIMEISGNVVLERIWEFMQPVSRTQITFVLPGNDPQKIVTLHDPIIAALQARDPAAAEEAIREHFRATAARFEAAFAPVGSQPSPHPVLAVAAGHPAPEPASDGRHRPGSRARRAGRRTAGSGVA